MSKLVDEALAGTLTPILLEDYIKVDRTIIDKPGGTRNLTPLAAAVIGGHLDVVELLLKNLADPDAVSPNDGRTPLLFATARKLKADQAAIVSALLRAGAEVDKSDEARGDNTPLMNAIVQVRDKAIVQLLVDHGADVKCANAKGKSAEDLAQDYGMESALRPRIERSEAVGHFIDLLVAAIMFILALINNGAIEGVVNGVVSKMYAITGKIDWHRPAECTAGQNWAANIAVPSITTISVTSAAPKVTPEELELTPEGFVEDNALKKFKPGDNVLKNPARKASELSEDANSMNSASITTISVTSPAPKVTPKELEQTLEGFVEDNALKKFFKPGNNFLKNLARKASALSKDANSIYINPDNVGRLITLSLYQTVIYCDDSSSMGYDDRYEHQGDLVTRISRIATRILPDGSGVDLRFINDSCASRLSAEQIAETIRRIRPNGGTMIGTNLRKKILEPLVYKILDSGEPLERPLLICIITDGYPHPEPEDTLKNAIVDCRRKLVTKGYESTAVIFLVSQIGNDYSASRFLENLRNDTEINDILYCTTDRLDETFKELKTAEDRLEEWLLKMLTSPMMS